MTHQQQLTAAFNDLSTGVMLATARKIAKLAQTDPVAAANAFDMHRASLDEADVKTFSGMIAKFSSELRG